MVRIYGHPFASFYWKALIALYERDVPFEFLMVDAEHPENAEFVGRDRPRLADTAVGHEANITTARFQQGNRDAVGLVDVLVATRAS